MSGTGAEEEVAGEQELAVREVVGGVPGGVARGVVRHETAGRLDPVPVLQALVDADGLRRRHPGAVVLRLHLDERRVDPVRVGLRLRPLDHPAQPPDVVAVEVGDHDRPDRPDRDPLRLEVPGDGLVGPGKARVDEGPGRARVLHQVNVGRELGRRVDAFDHVDSRQDLGHGLTVGGKGRGLNLSRSARRCPLGPPTGPPRHGSGSGPFGLPSPRTTEGPYRGSSVRVG